MVGKFYFPSCNIEVGDIYFWLLIFNMPRIRHNDPVSTTASFSTTQENIHTRQGRESSTHRSITLRDAQCSSVIQRLPSICEVLVWIPITAPAHFFLKKDNFHVTSLKFKPSPNVQPLLFSSIPNDISNNLYIDELGKAVSVVLPLSFGKS